LRLPFFNFFNDLKMQNPKYEINKDRAGEYRFLLRAINGEPILASSEGYNTKAGCLNGIQACRENCRLDNNYQRKIASDGQYYFTLMGGNYKTLGISEYYPTLAARENGIAACKRDGPTSNIEDKT